MTKETGAGEVAALAQEDGDRETERSPHEQAAKKDNRTRPLPAESDPGHVAFRIDRYPFYLIAHTLGRYVRRMEKALRRVGADQPHWRILVILGERGPSPVSQIADLAVYKLSTVTRILQRMEAAGLVSMRRSRRDGRVTEVSLTPEGEAQLRRIRAVGSAVANEAFSGFSRAEILTLIELLTRLDAALEEE
ncbi:MAG: MarR family transcriptional regulator [Alphaproteobacteria bacterium]|nr:MAG: MarR family transcriptional regulator [Alphaproteobacteria bacterium]